MSQGRPQSELGLTPPSWFWGVAAFGIISSSTSLLVWTWRNSPPLTTQNGKKMPCWESLRSSLPSSRTAGRISSAAVRFAESFSTTLRQSLREDSPLWVASLWFLWRQQPQSARTSLSGGSAGSSIVCSGNTAEDSKARLPTSVDAARASLDSWVIPVRDLMLLGSLLMYRKFRERQSQRQKDFGGRADRRDSHEETGFANDITKESIAAVDELRRLLKQSADSQGAMAAMLHPQQQLSQHSQRLQHSSSSSSLPKSSKQQRYIEILVHNVSHTDLVLSLDVPFRRSSTGTTDTAIPGANIGYSSAARTTGSDLDPPPPKLRTLDETKEDQDYDQYCLCRPRFSAFDAYSQRIVDVVDQDHKQGARKQINSESIDGSNVLSPNSIIRFARYERSDETNSYRIKAAPSTMKDKIPIGFRLQDDISSISGSTLQVSDEELHDLRVRGRDACRVVRPTTDANANVNESKADVVNSQLRINAVFFPLLATLMPIWQAKIKEKYGSDHDSSNSVKQVLFLVSGVGSPRNWTHSVKGNSTQQCATLMKYFLQTIYPNLVVVQIHSETNIFRYDENIAFVQHELLPRIQGYRDAHAKGLPYPDEQREEILASEGRNDGHATLSSSSDDAPFSTEWRKSFSAALSFADGSPARTFAIQAALRSFKPTFYHFWQLKTFWHDSKIVESDIEIHSFEEMETLPPVETTQLQDRPVVLEVVEEMKRFRDEMMRILSSSSPDSNDIRSFWLRKTHKPVLAVLAVHVGGGRIKLYRGTNMEVSMPTGSLCAERNVIGTALSDNPSLKRQDLKLIAVLAVPNPESWNAVGDGNGLLRQPSTLSLASLPTAAKEDDASQNASRTTRTAAHSPVHDSELLLSNKILSIKPPWVPSRKCSLGDEDEWILQDANAAASSASGTELSMAHPTSLYMRTSTTEPPQYATTKSSHAEPTASGSSTPARRIPLYKPHHKAKQEAKLMVVVHSNVDINPLRPCGACNEWLKKIAESNPYFQIVTFTDAECNGVYCTSCEE